MTIALPPLAKPITKPNPDAPYSIGSIVCLKCAPSRQYIALEVQADVDPDSDERHISNPVGERQHYLRGELGSVAHWWHSQLDLVF